jgi:putative oxidoreductase
MAVTFRDHPFNWLLRIVVGGGFLYAGVFKIADPAGFAIDVSNYRLVPHGLIHLVAIVVPWIEVVAGLCVLAGFWLRSGALIIMAMTVMFFFVITSALVRGLNIECGCFGTLGGRTIGLQSLAIDLAFFCLAALLMWRTRERLCPRVMV